MTVRLELDVNRLVNYSMHQNSLPVVEEIRVVNDSGVPLRDVAVTVRSNPEFLIPKEHRIDSVQPGQIYYLRPSGGAPLAAVDPDYLANLTERVKGAVVAELTSDSQSRASASDEVDITAFDEWPGNDYAEMISAFVTPNSPSLAALRAAASEVLGGWGESRSLEGYQSGDRLRAMRLVAAAYEAVRSLGITYVNPPASFEASGQRLRLCDQVIANREGTCADLSVLLCSLLESMGLNPLVIIVKGHMLAGVWLTDRYSPDIKIFDNASLTREARDDRLCAVECTSAVRGGQGFEAARQAGFERLQDADDFVCAVDVRRSRAAIRPIPVREMVDGRWRVLDAAPSADAERPDSVAGDFAIPEERRLDRLQQWERKLLDISPKNSLIRMRASKKLLPLLAGDMYALQKAVVGGRDLAVLEKPEEWKGAEAFEAHPFETGRYVSGCAKHLAAELGNGVLRTPLTKSETETAVKALYREASKSIEENGSNALYLALGVLKWYAPKSAEPSYAPLVLTPVSMVRKPGRGYVLRASDEDPMFNTTLIEKLRIDDDVEIPDLDAVLAEDPVGNLEKVLQIVRGCVAGKEGWDAMESASVGIFSFSQFVMWKDLESLSGRLAESKVVRSLMNSRLEWKPEPMDESSDPYDLCLTLPADSSQIRAVRAAGEGKSFVLHGPPGTGKSQTITNIISNALYHGKRVLFVAEKMVALQVVQSRLDALGVGNHCLEVHSNKADKSRVMEQLRAALEQCGKVSEKEHRAKVAKLERDRARLDGYAADFHRALPCGISVYDAICRYEAAAGEGLCDGDIEIPQRLLSQEYVATLTAVEGLLEDLTRIYEVIDISDPVMDLVKCTQCSAAGLEDVRTLLGELDASADREAGCFERLAAAGLPPDPAGGPEALLADLKSVDAAMMAGGGPAAYRAKLEAAAADCAEAAELLGALAGDASDLTPISAGALSAALARTRASAAAVKEAGYAGDLSAMEELAFNGGEVLAKMEAACAGLQELKASWSRDVLTCGRNFASEWSEINGSFLKKAFRKSAFMQDISRYILDPSVPFEALPAKLEAVNRAASCISDYRASLDDPGYRAAAERVPDCIGALRLESQRADAQLALMSKRPSMSPSDWAAAAAKAPALEECCADLAECRAARAAVDSALGPLLGLDLGAMTAGEASALTSALLPRVAEIQDIAIWNRCCAELSEMGLDSVWRALAAGADPGLLLQSFLRAYYCAMVKAGVQSSDNLRLFDSGTFEGTIAEFKKTDGECMKINRALLRHRLAENVPAIDADTVDGSETHTLYKAMNSKKMRKSLRTFFAEIPNLLPRLCPCMLMSPLSVSQYLSPDMPRFDLVVFDEASQLQTCRAVGALARGESAVVVGDPKQLPPTTFFEKSVVADDDDEDYEDLESLLDDCLGLPMPSAYLQWHYRSRHESLIAFSNRMFYDNRMLTFPSPNDSEKKVSMRLVDGVYEKNRRVNPIEAEAVADEVVRRLKDPELRKMSIGVVAFNQTQQECIDDLLQARIAADPSLYDAAYGDEPVFIKNLESVQGDERDVIMFSIGYGPDRNGNVLQNFGPINRSGGGRRLNVAVSRARCEMVVFSSMTSDRVRPSALSSSGVKYLRDFLWFAQNSGHFESEEALAARGGSSDIACELAAELGRMGYETRFDIGNSDYRVDVAVVDPDDPERYSLGIIVDGSRHDGAENTRDREFAKCDVLRRLGWSLATVWPLEWFYDRKGALRRVRAALSGAKRAQAEPAEEYVPPVEEVRRKAAPGRKAEYVQGSYGRPGAYYPPSTVGQHLAEIVAGEGPIARDFLVQTACRSFGHSRSSVVGCLDSGGFVSTTRTVGPDTYVTYWPPGVDAGGYRMFRVPPEGGRRRSADQIPMEELMNAVMYKMELSSSADVPDLVSSVAREFGYARSGSKVQAIIEDAVGLCVADGKLGRSGERVFL